MAEPGIHDLDTCADGDGIEKPDDIPRAHANAAVAGGAADAVFLGGAVNVDAASEGAGVLRFEPAQVEDAGDDWIAAWRVGREDFTGAALAAENCADRSVAADFCGDLKHSERRGEAAWTISHTELGSGDGEFCDANAVFHEGEALIRDADDDHRNPIHRETASSEQDEQSENKREFAHQRLRANAVPSGARFNQQ